MVYRNSFILIKQNLINTKWYSQKSLHLFYTTLLNTIPPSHSEDLFCKTFPKRATSKFLITWNISVEIHVISVKWLFDKELNCIYDQAFAKFQFNRPFYASWGIVDEHAWSMFNKLVHLCKGNSLVIPKPYLAEV